MRICLKASNVNMWYTERCNWRGQWKVSHNVELYELFLVINVILYNRLPDHVVKIWNFIDPCMIAWWKYPHVEGLVHQGLDGRTAYKEMWSFYTKHDETCL